VIFEKILANCAIYGTILSNSEIRGIFKKNCFYQTFGIIFSTRREGKKKWELDQFDVNVAVEKLNSLLQPDILLVALSIIMDAETAYGKAQLLNHGEVLHKENKLHYYDKSLFFSLSMHYACTGRACVLGVVYSGCIGKWFLFALFYTFVGLRY